MAKSAKTSRPRIKSSSRSLRGPKPAGRTVVTLKPAMSAAQAGVDILRPLVGRFFELAGGLGVESDTEQVHKMRVVARRIRSAARMFKRVLGKGLLALVGKLKAFVDALGAVRDEDVFIEFLRGAVRRIQPVHRPTLRALLDERLARRHRLYLRAVKAIQSEAFGGLERRWRRAMDAPATRGQDAHTTRDGLAAGEFAARRLSKLLDKVLHFDRPLDSYRPVKLHRLRIHFKRLRYAGEFFESLYGQQLVLLVVEPAKEMQDFLGGAHDVEVFKKILQARGKASNSRQAADAIDDLCKLLDRRHEELVGKAQKGMKGFIEDKEACEKIISAAASSV